MQINQCLRYDGHSCYDGFKIEEEMNKPSGIKDSYKEVLSYVRGKDGIDWRLISPYIAVIIIMCATVIIFR